MKIFIILVFIFSMNVSAKHTKKHHSKKIHKVEKLAIIKEAKNDSKKRSKKIVKKTPKKEKISFEDAKEHCLISKGASISDSQLEECINKTMNSQLSKQDLAI